MLEVVVLTGSAFFPMCDRSRVAYPHETRFAGIAWRWGWLSRSPSLAPGAEGGCVHRGGCAWIWAWLKQRRGSVSCWKQRP